MNTFHFSDSPQQRHRVHRQPGSDQVIVDGHAVAVTADTSGRFSAQVDGRPERLHAVAHGDGVYVQWRGRAWRIDRLDPTRASAAAGGDAAGLSMAPMPGVVVSWQAAVGQRVSEGGALLVIESMKLQMTITASCGGTLAELPVAVGQTFQRNAVLARVAADEATA
jgi:acetyl/propionyl-CoA carboxylase alpha subunit